MNPFSDISENNLHHAYLMVGDFSDLQKDIIDFVARLGMEYHGNPDVRHTKQSTLTTDVAREIINAVAQKNFSNSSSSEKGKKIFILETEIITEEAQNALLKVFEEPTEGTHFFIIMPQNILLPTLLSRVQVVSRTVLDCGMSMVSLDSVCQMKMSERLELVKEITEGITEAKSNQNGLIARSDEIGFREEKTKQDAISLVNRIEEELYRKGVSNSAESLRITQSARQALYDRGAPVKMILEHVMLTI